MATKNRPPFVLAHMADMQGCGYQRIAMPVGALVGAGLIEAHIQGMPLPANALAALNPDVVVWQRQLEEIQIEQMTEARRAAPGAHFVYELDDYLVGVPDESYHAGFMPPGMDGRISRALALCDSASTTTPAMADWLTSLGAKDVRVIGNLIPLAKIREQPEKPSGKRKFRIGFGGGMSHGGDVRILYHAMETLGDRVEWVFIGMNPENPPVPVEYHDGVPPFHYLDALYNLKLDLALAPLQDNHFNVCKSNLRILESAACDYPVIAQDMPSYHTGAPPVFGYAGEPESWTREIQRFIATSSVERKRNARDMRAWVGKGWTLESQLIPRLRAWLPKDAEYWRPHSEKPGTDLIVACSADSPARKVGASHVRRAKHVASLVEACERSLAIGGDVLWLRPGTTLTDDAWTKLRAVLTGHHDAAAVVPIGSDGANAFPVRNAFTPLPPAFAARIDRILHEKWPGRVHKIGMLSGACVLLRGTAVAMLGAPDTEGCGGNEEAALAEWGAKAQAKQFNLLQAADTYVGSLGQPPNANEALMVRAQLRGVMQYAQTGDAGLSPEERESVELSALAYQHTGLRPGSGGLPHDYPTWSKWHLTHPAVTRPNGSVPERRVNIHVVEFGQSFPAGQTGDDWFVFVDDRTSLRPEAIQAFHDACAAASPDTAVVYADHEVQMRDQLIPWFKTAFDRERLYSQDYITHCMAVRGSELWPRAAPVKDRIALYEYVIRLGGTNAKIQHIPYVLAVTREGSPEERGVETLLAQQVVERALPGAEVFARRELPGCLNVKRRVPKDKQPKVTVIVPTQGDGWLLDPCLNTLFGMTAYANYEVLLMVNNPKATPPAAVAKQYENERRLRKYTVADTEFNWSKLNNDAVALCPDTDIFCFLNDDTRVAHPEWLELMVGQATQPDVACVGAKLLYPAQVIQHVGVICHKGVAGHLHKGTPAQQTGYWNVAAITHENSAVTAACMVIEAKKFREIGGFDESYAHNFNDVVFCLEARKKGYRNVVEINADVQHAEGSSRGAATPEGQRRMRAEMAKLAAEYPDPDPYWSPNNGIGYGPDGLSVAGLDCNMLAWEDNPDAALGRERVLVINDADPVNGPSFRESQEGYVVVSADLADMRLTLTAPLPANVKSWDIRDSAPIKRLLTSFDIHRIVFCGLSGRAGHAAPVEALRMLASLGAEIEYAASNAEVVCPKLNFMRGGAYCGEGYKHGIATCQACVREHPGPFGFVDVPAWHDAWAALLETAKVVPQQIAAE